MEKNPHKRARTRAAAKKAAKGTIVALSAIAAVIVPAKARAQTIDCFQDINYGSIVPCPGAATMEIDPSGGVSASGCLNYNGTQIRGRCLITTAFTLTQPIQVSVTGVPENIVSGANNMVVNPVVVRGGTETGQTITFTPSGFVTIVDIGSTLNVGGGQASGTYNGSVTVNVNYAP